MSPNLVMQIIGSTAQVGLGIYGAVMAEFEKGKAIDDQKVAQDKLDALIDNRQEIINPYENITDLSDMLNNPFANLGVATQAAEIQIEQADISLANTLDTIRATGASAGGATALAQAALQSKRGVSASIEKQEAQNEQLKAQGEQKLIQQQMSEAKRIQQAQASGDAFVYGETEKRELMELDRTSGMLENAQAREMQAIANRNAAIGAAIGGVSNAGNFYQPTKLTDPNNYLNSLAYGGSNFQYTDLANPDAYADG